MDSKLEGLVHWRFDCMSFIVGTTHQEVVNRFDNNMRTKSQWACVVA